MLRPLQAASRSLFAQFARGTGTIPVQTAALPWRQRSDGSIELLLITSRSTGRWIIPKGRLMNGKSLAEAAAIEAFEEAGVKGPADERPIGSFDHLKQDRLLGPVPYRVVVHPLAVEQVLAQWPERGERQRRWFAPDEAAERVESAQLADLMRRFDAGTRSEHKGELQQGSLLAK